MRSISRVKIAFVVALVCASIVPAPPAHALFHLIKITEVFPGTSQQGAAQFIELQMYSDNQRFLASHEVVVFDASGTEKATFTFTTAMQNGASQSYVLVATAEAEETFGVEADLQMDSAAISANGGKVCFRSNNGELIDCASWGSYSGDDTGSGTPFNAPLGLTPDRSMQRDISADDPNTLEESDDSNDSAADFDFASPTPTNNSGGAAGANDHERSVSLTLGGRGKLVAAGRVRVRDGFERCAADVPVKLQRRRSGRWATIKGARTGAEGDYRITAADRAGTYRVRAPEVSATEEDRCLAAASPRRRNG